MTSTGEEPCNPITTHGYWEQSWSLTEVPDTVDPDADAPAGLLYRALHEQFARVLVPRYGPGASLIEIGCGGSQWLPYFRRTFGYEISGIDYSPSGIRLSRLILQKAGLSANVVHGDLFSPPPEMVEAFDVVTSFGVVEHFDPTADAVAACARYLRPGGVMITEVPTMRGPHGLLYRVFRPSIYRQHIPQSRHALAAAHKQAGLQVTDCRYVLGLPAVLKRPPATAPMTRKLAFALSVAVWWLDRHGVAIPPNGLTSPYALCIATKPARGT
jgi:SAM-dependent methyltransferase